MNLIKQLIHSYRNKKALEQTLTRKGKPKGLTVGDQFAPPLTIKYPHGKTVAKHLTKCGNKNLEWIDLTHEHVLLCCHKCEIVIYDSTAN